MKVFWMGALAAAMMATLGCDKGSEKETSESAEEQGEKKKDDEPKVSKEQVEAAIEPCGNLTKQDECTASAKKLGEGALPILKEMFPDSVKKHREVRNAYLTAKKGGDKKKLAAAARESTSAFRYTQGIVRMAVASGPKGCELADELMKHIKETCSDEKPPGEHSSECSIEKFDIGKALKPCK